MKKLALTLALAAALGSAQAQTKWDLPSGYGPNTFQVQNLQWFADEVGKATGGKLKITVHPGASLFKANEIKRAVQTGQTQIGEFILSGAANENALFGIDSIPFLATTYAQARKLNDISNPALEKLLASQGLKLLYAVPWPGQSLYSGKAVKSLADLKGTKMRAYNPATTRIAELVGAQPVTIQLAELPQALATGGVDNFLTSSASGVESKLYEQVKFFYDVNAWLPRNAVVVNMKAFDTLDAATKAALTKVGETAGERGWKTSDQKDDEYLKELAAKGMTVDRSSETLKRELQAIGNRMAADWARQAGAEGQAILDAYRK
ncbi:MAG TPA: TRAP transporter substrate-binding protein [Rubrivivax sp.]|nr:TRAP transporter substrate-binding protein [Rubrivivax sp.]